MLKIAYFLKFENNCFLRDSAYPGNGFSGMTLCSHASGHGLLFCNIVLWLPTGYRIFKQALIFDFVSAIRIVKTCQPKQNERSIFTLALQDILWLNGYASDGPTLRPNGRPNISPGASGKRYKPFPKTFTS